MSFDKCTLWVRWYSSWDEIGRRYGVVATAHSGNSTQKVNDWTSKCRSIANNDGWNHNPQTWPTHGDPFLNAEAACDINFVHGPVGYHEYLEWHQEVSNHWLGLHPDCDVYMVI
ncbi:uncharacterized protein B0I36DRAFT_258175 [Microdochium trichocladiopsis]|uniref:Uncharacterized protein n=1 Tax=Microdochium trichocladiopsis TaxID=1682393 RepID=A0A9P9BER4_9PEZI|nr:uncharacterized protein B0I36DRAFT_258175 [Microdochium trichocladiopsis]KAH7009078.1 hypothetical protein B0I36DRAFT_258175 [Microdochium trichocladiopsis]